MRDRSQQQSPSDVVAALSDLVLHPAYSENTIRKILREERPDVIEICDKYNLQYLGGMIEMMRSLEHDRARDYRLILVGEGMERELLEQLTARQAPGKVYFFDHITDRERLAEVYAGCDLFVRTVDTLASFPPYAWSTPATNYADAVIAASSAMAQTFYRAMVRFGIQSPGSKIPSPRYMQMVPSVTGREEKSAVILHPRRAD